MKFKKIFWKVIGYSILVLIVSLIILSIVKSHKTLKVGKIDNYVATLGKDFSPEGSYKKYLNDLKDENVPLGTSEGIGVDLTNVSTESTTGAYEIESSGYNFFDYEKNKDTSITGLYTADYGIVKFDFTVPAGQAGLYNLFIEYASLVEPDGKGVEFQSKTGDIQRVIRINGKVPFSEASQIKFTRKWKDVITQGYEQDKFNNNVRPIFLLNDKKDEIRPDQEEVISLTSQFIGDFDNFTIDPYFFNLEEGLNTIEFEAIREPIFIKSLTFKIARKIPKYSEYMQANSDIQEYKGENIKIEAESMYLKGTPVIVPTVDLVSPKAKPHYRGKATKLNIIGNYSWRMPGYWVSYKINVPETALYNLTIIGKQDVKAGGFSGRQIKIDGEIPFYEASYIPFQNRGNLTKYEIKNKKDPYLFRLEKGERIISFYVSNGNFSEVLQVVNDTIDILNALYLEVVKITKQANDPNITYDLARKIPGLEDVIQLQIKKLEDAVKEYHRISNNNTGRTSVIRNMIMQLKKFNKKPDRMAGALASFKSNIAAMGTWVLGETEQPFTMDSFVLHKSKAKIGRVSPNVFESVWHEFKKFLFSFGSQTSFSSGGKGKTKVKVWMSAGRDNVQIVKRLIDNDFAKKHSDIAVDLELVPVGVLLRATVSGKGPDIALNNAEGTPIDFAFRGAAYDLRNFPDFEQFASEFPKSSITPFEFNGGVYALPEQLVFPVLFYRTDLFEKYNLVPPTNYEELDDVIRILQKENLNFYIESGAGGVGMTSNTVSSGLYGTMLYQMGGTYYNHEGTKTALDSDIANDAFVKFTKYFTEGGLEVVVNFLNRFRSGEVAAGITGYPLYNSLAVFAPEIAGKWAIAKVPSFLSKEVLEENPNHPTAHKILSNVGSSSLILEGSKKKEAAWEFMKWWLSEDIQLKYGQDLEITMGAAARYTAARKDVLEKLAWPSKDFVVISESMDNTEGVPQVPGGYMTTRQFSYAFLAAVEDAKNPYEMLSKYIKDINPELEKKRKEFE